MVLIDSKRVAAGISLGYYVRLYCVRGAGGDRARGREAPHAPIAVGCAVAHLRERRVVGFEALARWTDPDLGSVPPSVFIPIAEERGIIGPLSQHVLRKATARPAQEDKPGLPVHERRRLADENSAAGGFWNPRFYCFATVPTTACSGAPESAGRAPCCAMR